MGSNLVMKQLIIHNVNVKDCCYLRVTMKENFCLCNSTWREDTVTRCSQCEGNEHCYYKEWQRLKIKNNL